LFAAGIKCCGKVERGGPEVPAEWLKQEWRRRGLLKRGQEHHGFDGDEQMMIATYKAMPDLHLTIEDIIADGDKVACRNVWRWTDSASGKKMQFHGFVL
jgi:predicted ester cyclase